MQSLQIIHADRRKVLPRGGDAAVTEDLEQVEEIPTIAEMVTANVWP
jgi:hypothetical protein